MKMYMLSSAHRMDGRTNKSQVSPNFPTEDFGASLVPEAHLGHFLTFEKVDSLMQEVVALSEFDLRTDPAPVELLSFESGTEDLSSNSYLFTCKKHLRLQRIFESFPGVHKQFCTNDIDARSTYVSTI